MKATAQIFLSHAREDAERVEQLYQKLSDAGFKPWMDKRDILPGERWPSSIRKAIRHSDFFLVCLSANSIDKRGWIQREIKQALDIWQEKLESDIYLIPVRLEDCEVPESLRDFQWVDLFEKNGWTRLVEAIQVGMNRRLETPTTPPSKPQLPLPTLSSPDELESPKRQTERPLQIQVGDVRASEGVAVGQNIVQVIISRASTIPPRVLIPFFVIVVVLLAAIAGVIVIPVLKSGPTATPTKTPKLSPVAVVLVGPPTATATTIPSPTPTSTPLPEARKLYYLLILDASSRMADGFEGSDSKWVAAKESALDLLTSGLPSRANYGLIVLGGNQPGSTQTCEDPNQMLVPLDLDQRRTVIEKIESMQPQGVASLTGAIALARDQLLSLPGDLEKTIIVITGGGDSCHPDDEWESLLDLLELSFSSVNAYTELIILADENIDEEVLAAVQEITFLGLENVRADASLDNERLIDTTDNVVDRAMERAREVEPVAIAAEETAVAAIVTTVAVAPSPTTKPPATTPEPTVVAGVTPSPGPVMHTATATHTPTPIPTGTPTPTPTNTQTPTPTRTPVATPTFTPTATSTSTSTPLPSPTPILTPLQLDDPGFEGSGFRKPPWEEWGWPLSDDGGTRDPDATDCAHSDNQALKITRVTTASVWAGNVVEQQIDFNAGQTLRFDAWLKIQKLSGEAYVELVFASGSEQADNLESHPGNKFSSEMDWTQISVEGTAPEGTTVAKLDLVVMYPPEGTGTVCFDDMRAFVQQE